MCIFDYRKVYLQNCISVQYYYICLKTLERTYLWANAFPADLRFPFVVVVLACVYVGVFVCLHVCAFVCLWVCELWVSVFVCVSAFVCFCV